MESVEDDYLRLLTHDELPILLELYKKHLPFATSAYYFILDQCHRNEFINKNKDVVLSDRLLNSLYTYKNGDLAKNGTFISVSKGKNFVSFAFTVETSLAELKECLWNSKFIDWTVGTLFLSVHDAHKSLLLSHLERNGLKADRTYPCGCYLMGKEKAAQFEYIAPEGYELRKLEQCNAELINEQWPHKSEGSVVFVRGLIEINGGIGLFKEQSGELVSWVVKNDYSGMGLLQTIESEQRKGFATIVVKAFCKRIALMDQEHILAFAIEENTKAHRLLAGIGFDRLDTSCCFIDFEEKI